ncbi:hypothetical protein HOD08_04515 [bacterium]|jgi:ATP:ADP antiporter, AAA family|nr:hypothetical protein [bacterium]
MLPSLSALANFAIFLTRFDVLLAIGAAITFSVWITGNGRRVVKALWGDLTPTEASRFAILGSKFFIIIGAYWALRSIKDAFFNDLVGLEFQPKAKILSLFVIIPVVLMYTKLVDMVEKHKLFTIICSFYATLYVGIALFHMANVPAMTSSLVSWIPGSGLGWFSYVAIESFGGIIVAHFFAFVASTTTTESAKRGYGLLFFAGQLGNLIGPTLIVSYLKIIKFSGAFIAVAISIMIVPLITTVYMHFFPEASEANEVAKKPKTSVFEGVRLLSSHGYLMGLAFVAVIYEVIGTILDLQLKMTARSSGYVGEALGVFMARYAQATASLAIVFALVGTSFFIRRFGVRFCLVAYPALLGLVVFSARTYPLLAVFFVGMVLVKAFSYALNNPMKEMLYLPTSKDVKFKVKSIIDAFGGKLTKSVGSVVNNAFVGNMGSLVAYGSLFSLGVVGVWVVIALAVGSAYNKLMARNEIIS